ncbi:MAG: M55 family metallopeptidase [Spirochaetes bacterium]|jgi:D-aminopeptidase|nr:M55 family metallopeptidase [Spirochaetota bacterium]
MAETGDRKKILVIADIEGSTGCWSKSDSEFMDPGWPGACAGMSLDVDAVVRALFECGAESVTVKDFHRTGYNLLPELIDRRAAVIHGYRNGPVPGIGDPGGAGVLMMTGMHAASGTDGFLAHTLTSRISLLEVNGKPVSEAELFSSSLAPFGAAPLFFSGCPEACRHAERRLDGIITFPIDKTAGREGFDPRAWREKLAASAAKAFLNAGAIPYLPAGPFSARVVMRDGPGEAERICSRWNFKRRGAEIYIMAEDMAGLYRSLIRLAYLTPLTEKILPAGLGLYNLYGRSGLAWVRRNARDLIRREQAAGRRQVTSSS